MRNAIPYLGGTFSVLLICLHALPAAASDDALQAAKAVPGNIHFVSAGGYWQRGKEEGFYRAVVVSAGVEHVSHSLLIQWLRSDAASKTYTLTRTENVKELRLGQGYVLEVKTSFGEVNAFKIDVTANRRAAKPKTFAITAKGDGTYTVQ